MLQRLDVFITTVGITTSGAKDKFQTMEGNISENDWAQTIFPHIEARARNDKLLLTTMFFRSSELGAVFIKNVDTPTYRTELRSYYLHFTYGLMRGAVTPPLFKSLYKAKDLVRNLYIAHGLDIKLEKVINETGSRQEYKLIRVN